MIRTARSIEEFDRLRERYIGDGVILVRSSVTRAPAPVRPPAPPPSSRRRAIPPAVAAEVADLRQRLAARLRATPRRTHITGGLQQLALICGCGAYVTVFTSVGVCHACNRLRNLTPSEEAQRLRAALALRA